MTTSNRSLPGVWLLCIAALFLATTSASAQIIRPGGGGDLTAGPETKETLPGATQQQPTSPRLQHGTAHLDAATPHQHRAGDTPAAQHLALYRLLEQQERLMQAGAQRMGVYAVGESAQHAEVATGVYLIRVGTGSQTQVYRVIIRN